MSDFEEGRVKMTKAEKVLKALTELSKNCHGRDVCIMYSTISEQFYFSIPCEIKEGHTLRGPREGHRNTIEDAAVTIMRELQGKHLVFNAGNDEKRREVFFYQMEEGDE